MEKVAVQLGQRSYPIVIAPGLLSGAGQVPELQQLWQFKKVVILSNPVVAALYLPQLQALFGQQQLFELLLPDGEAYKNLQSFDQANTFLLEHGIARDALLVALGGGVIGDLTGFVAACYQRGVAFVQVPTTLLSQVDSSVGGKTAINHPLGKNMIGAFNQPLAVIIDTSVLHSLPQREFSAGMAEVIKYGLLGDAAFFQWLEQQQDALARLQEPQLSQMIKHCCQMKADIVSRDETEQGERALLNLGHTFGHAIEAWLGYGTWLHGEAVAVGMMMAFELAYARGWIDAPTVARVRQLLVAFELPVQPPLGMQIADFMPYMKTDKKVKDGKMRFILPQTLGAAIIVDDVTESELQRVFAG
ncbi:3-dehydroquinate synthase [Rheinheimera riviphila]|uniref:3-dehydroquinate synthase n=1 Tax=Rheinheimera riviphila TaxID=1834037 RepID=A0A437R0W5_9GAMM|nr:3-dehydroquinate synthase [Rheinheimera riviphila]RVU40353.1 3-dehydroquinate synthase [Rheinheimera riviphila]